MHEAAPLPAWLAVPPDRRMGQTALTAFPWHDRPDAQGQTGPRRVPSHLRGALGGATDALVTDAGEVSPRPG